jgi:hypothetical protein
MAKRRTQPQVRKTLLVWGGVVIGVALLGFVLTTFVGGGGGSTPPPSSAAGPSVDRKATPQVGVPKNPSPASLRAGGRDPFHALIAQGSSQPNPAPAATPAPEAAAAASPGVLLETISVESGVADIRIDAKLHENAKPGAQLSGGFVLEAIEGDCAFIARSPERFRVCEGERFLK